MLKRSSFPVGSVVLLLALVAGPHDGFAQRSVKEEVAFLDKAAHIPDMSRQQELLHAPAWRSFVASHPLWNVEFNTSSGKPRRAFGPPIHVAGATAEEQARSFIAQDLAVFGIPAEGLIHASTIAGAKTTFVHFTQEHQGLPVLRAKLMVKLDPARGVIAFGADVYDDITVSTTPGLSAAAALEIAANDLQHVVNTEFIGLRILPVPMPGYTDHRLVHEALVHTRNGATPGRFRSLVDAHNGKLWYRMNEVMDHQACGGSGQENSAQVVVQASVRPNGPLEPAEVLGMPNLRVTVNGSTFFTDADGVLDTGIPGPANAVAQLRGRWANVTTNGVLAGLSATVEEGPNVLDLTAVSTMRERSAYYAVNRIHAHAKAVLPAFTGMDTPLPTKVDVTGNACNAFYDGASINFYAAGNGCRAYALLHDVVYHEYGHGINDKFYQSFSAAFINGAMNEGYADLWAMTLTGQPTIGRGYQTANDALSIRRYDQGPRVYPQDLVGQVHADGQIIAGAWWSTAELLGDMDAMIELFAATLPGLQAMFFSGEEGAAFRDVLLDALQADDDDGNIANGTPNGDVIVQAFARHGITLLSNIALQHVPALQASASNPIPLDLTATITFPFQNYIQSVKVYYRSSPSLPWENLPMEQTAWGQYSGSLPAQTAGTPLAYHFAMEDIFGERGAVLPVAAAQEQDANVPFFTLVGMDLQATEDGDLLNELGPWTAGVPSDNATAGQWVLAVPIPSFSGSNGTGFPVQPGTQTTPGGTRCWVTANASSPADPMGAADVDGGVTTLISSPIDLTAYQDPVVVYQRWYMNNPPGGSNPRDDWWQVQVSGDGGSTWNSVEDTRMSERAWRRMAFRVQDVMPLSNTFRIRFMASDSIRPGMNASGASIVEAAVDDIQIWDVADISTGVEAVMPVRIHSIHPSPANDVISIRVANGVGQPIRFEIFDASGRMVLSPAPTVGGDVQRIAVDGLAAGHYVLRSHTNSGSAHARFSIAR